MSQRGFTLLGTAVPFWGQTSLIPSSLSPKRDCSPKRVKNDHLVRCVTHEKIRVTMFFVFLSSYSSMHQVCTISLPVDPCTAVRPLNSRFGPSFLGVGVKIGVCALQSWKCQCRHGTKNRENTCAACFSAVIVDCCPDCRDCRDPFRRNSGANGRACALYQVCRLATAVMQTVL